MFASIMKFCARNPFRKSIIVIITIKIMAIFLIWGLFFSHPTSKQLNKEKLTHHYIAEAYKNR